jgi:RHS repeat-associated protein
MDNKSRVALVETRTLDVAGSDRAPVRMIRYQFGNQLGSASLELDEQAQIISYEEYSPYGSSTYQAVRSKTETPKRYRYTGKERDEESGLCYHGARYYTPWLGTWASCDPEGLIDGENLYCYCSSRPLVITDPTGTDGVYDEDAQVCRPETSCDAGVAMTVPGAPPGIATVRPQPRKASRAQPTQGGSNVTTVASGATLQGDQSSLLGNHYLHCQRK